MDYRPLFGTGFRVPALTLGTGTFSKPGGSLALASTDLEEAVRLVHLCIDHGLTMFDTADAYADGVAEDFLGKAIRGRREQVLISTKAGFRTGKRPHDQGTSRAHLVESCEASLRRLGTDVIDLYQMHLFDAFTPIEETLDTLDTLVRAGKVRYIGCSNFSGWHLMKSLAYSDRHGLARYVAHQAYYSLIGRDYEAELMPLAIDQKVATVAWSPLGWGRLTGKVRRGAPLPAVSRLHTIADKGPPVPDEYVFDVVDVLDAIAKETGKTVPQIALNWLLQRPTVSTVIIGARNESQLRDNLGAVGWNLTKEQVARLDAASLRDWPYPYWHQRMFASDINPPPV